MVQVLQDKELMDQIQFLVQLHQQVVDTEKTLIIIQVETVVLVVELEEKELVVLEEVVIHLLSVHLKETMVEMHKLLALPQLEVLEAEEQQ